MWCRGVELGDPGVAPVVQGADGCGDPGRAGDGLGVTIESEAVFWEESLDPGRRLHLESVVDGCVVQPCRQFARAVGGIPVNRGLVVGFGFGRLGAPHRELDH